MNQKTKYNLLLLLSITAYAGDEPKEQNQNTVNNQNEQQIVENLVNPENENLQPVAENQALSLLHAQKEKTKLTGQHLRSFACDLRKVTPYLTLQNTLGLAAQNTRIHGTIAACVYGYSFDKPEKNLIKIKQAMKSGKLNLFVSPLASEKHHYYPGSTLWSPLFDGRQKALSKIFAQDSIPHIFTHCQPNGKQYKFQGCGDFTKKYPIIQGKRGSTEVPLVGEIALTHPLTLHLTTDVYRKISELRRCYDREPTGDYNSTQEIEKREKLPEHLRINPLYHYNEILQLRKTPLIVGDLGDLKRYDSNLLKQVVRCEVDLDCFNVKYEPIEKDWILDTIKKYSIQVSANISVDSMLCTTEKKYPEFVHKLFETELVSELSLVYDLLGSPPLEKMFTGFEKALQKIPKIDTVRSLSLMLQNAALTQDTRDIVYHSLNKMPRLKKFTCNISGMFYFRQGNRLPTDLRSLNFKDLEDVHIFCKDLEDVNIFCKAQALRYTSLYNETASRKMTYEFFRPLLPKNVPNLNFRLLGLHGNKDVLVSILQDFDNLKSLNYPVYIFSFEKVIPVILKHQNLESLVLNLVDVQSSEQVEAFYKSLSALKSLKTIVLKPSCSESSQDRFPGATLLFKSSKEYPSLSKISFDCLQELAMFSLYEANNKLVCNIADLLFQAFDVKSDSKIKDGVVFDLIFDVRNSMGNFQGFACLEKYLRRDLESSEEQIRAFTQEVENHPHLASWSKEMKSQVRKRIAIYCKEPESGITWRVKSPDLN